MKKTQFIELLNKLEEIYLTDQKKQKATDEYFKEIYPDSYAPAESSTLVKCIEVLSIEYKDIAENLEYYFFEAKNMEDARVCYKDNEYNFATQEELLRCMITEGFIYE